MNLALSSFWLVTKRRGGERKRKREGRERKREREREKVGSSLALLT